MSDLLMKNCHGAALQHGHVICLLRGTRQFHTSHLPVFCSHDGLQISHRRCVAVRQTTSTCTDNVLPYARLQGDCRVLNLGCCAGYVTADVADKEGLHKLNLSGTKFRKALRAGEDIPDWFAFKSVVQV